MSEIKFPIQMYDPSRDYLEHLEQYNSSVLTVLGEGNFINGHQVKTLERKLEDFTGSKHAITCGNGTDALFIALKALDIGPGDEVITVALTWISSAETISMTGAKPVFIDVKNDTFCMNEELIESAITTNTKAILPVSLYGYMPDYKKIREIANKHNLYVIEDGAQSFGAERDNYKSCSSEYTHISTTSFFPTKPLGCYGDGGSMFTNDDELALKLRAIKSHGGIERFKHKYIGVNSRLDTIQAAVLLLKLNNFEESLKNRNNCANYYSQTIIEKSKNVIVPMNNMSMHAWAQYSLLLPSKIERDRMVKKLKDHNVNVAIFYPVPLYHQECFDNNVRLSETEDICDRILNLPCYGHFTNLEQNYIIDLLE